MEIYGKLQKCRLKIKELENKKGGKNEFSKYSYFTPSQVSDIVSDACNEFGVIWFFSLEKDEFGYYGELKLVNIDSSTEIVRTTLRTDIPSLKATNSTQQMGGAMTYTQRYMLMSAFDIAENSSDFDSKDHRKIEEKNKPVLDMKSPKWLVAKERVKDGMTYEEIQKHYSISIKDYELLCG